jgi:hypothetical protein
MLVVSAGRKETAGAAGVLVAQIGASLAEVYLEFLGGRCRPNTVRAAGYDLKVFFAAVARPPDQVRPGGPLADAVRQVAPGAGVALHDVRARRDAMPGRPDRRQPGHRPVPT